MDPSSRRLKDIDDHLSEDYALLKVYEDDLRLESDPQRQKRIERRIEETRNRIDSLKVEREQILGGPWESSVTVTPGDGFIERALIQLGAKSYGVRREGLIREAVQQIRQEPALPVLLQGLDGVGKRTLVCDVVRDLREEFPQAFVIVFDGPAAIEPAYILEEINDFLRAQGRGLDPERLQEKIQRQTLQLLIGQMQDLDVLVVLIAVDSLSPGWLKALLGDLAAAQVRVIATATNRPLDSPQVRMVSVTPLADAETLDFIAEYARVFNLDVSGAELLKRIPSGIRSHPLALTTLLCHLQDVELDLLLLGGIPEGARVPAKLVEQAITLLKDSERESLALIELLSDIDLSGVIKALRLSPSPALPSVVQTLLFRSLIYRAAAAYVVPAIVSEALTAVAPETKEKATLAISEALREAIKRLEEDDTGLPQLAVTSARIVHRLSEEQRWELVYGLTEVTYLELLNLRGYWKEYSLLLRLGAAGAKHAGDEHVNFQLNCQLGRKLLQMGDIEGARGALAEAEKYRGAQSGTLDLAELHSHRALLYTLENKQPEALEELAESRRIREALGDRKGLAMVEQLTGNLHLIRRENQQALDAYLRALEILADEGSSKERLDVQTNVARCEQILGRLEDAERRLMEVLAECKKLRYDAGVPRVLYYLALIAESRNHTLQAIDLAQQAVGKAPLTDQGIAQEAKLLANRLKMMEELRRRKESDEQPR